MARVLPQLWPWTLRAYSTSQASRLSASAPRGSLIASLTQLSPVECAVHSSTLSGVRGLQTAVTFTALHCKGQLATGISPAHQTAMPQCSAALSPLASTQMRMLAASSESAKAASLRRLAAAKTRRERDAKALVQQQRPGMTASERQLAEQPQQPPGDAVMAVEGPASEVQLARVLQRPALVVTRAVEWGTVILGYEQANKYQVLDETGQVVALMAEDQTGLANALGRQLLRTRRSFTATVFSADGSQVLFRVKRPAYLISSHMIIEDGAGNEVGEVHQRWALLKRNYDLYMHKRQFAAISGNFLAWEFELKDVQGGTLALIDRNFSGFAKEIFTDAGKYVIHFGTAAMGPEPTEQQQQLQLQQFPQDAGHTQAGQLPGRGTPAASATGAAAYGASAVGAAQAGPMGQPGPTPPVSPMAMARTDVVLIPTVSGNQLAVARPLALTERMLVLACAICIDYDYFSQHSRSGGLFSPPIIMPLPIPGGGGGGEGAAGEAGPAAGPADVAGGAAAGSAGAATDAGLGGTTGSGDAPDGFGAGGAGDGGWRPDDMGGGGTGGMFGGGDGGGGDGEMKWDLPGAGEDGGDGGGGIGGILGTLWGLFGGGSD